MITRRRRRSVRRVSAVRRVSRRRVRRNPSIRRAKRPSPPKMTPAMRRKIGLAVKAANRRRAASRGVVARVSSRVRSVIRRRPTMTVARRSGRRSISRSSLGGGSITSTFKSAFSKPMLMKVAGAIGASMGVGYIFKNYGAKLPMANSKYGRVGYSLALPIAAAFLVRKKAPAVAEGLVIGALVMAVTEVIRMSRSTTGGVLAAYPSDMQVTNVKQLPGFGVAGELGFNAYPTSVGTMGTRLNSPAFPTGIWGN